MKKLPLKNILIGTFLIVIVLLGVAFYAGRYIFQGMDMISSCAESIEHEIVSPDKKYVATVYIRNCGATTDYVTHLNLRNASGGVNKFGAQGVVTAGEVFTIAGKQSIEATWKDSTNLEIRLPEIQPSTSLTDGGTWNSVHIKIGK